MSKNWKTNLGGAISVTGTALIGVGLVPQVGGGPSYSQFLTILAIVGFVLSAVGKGVTALFAADAKTVDNIAAAVDHINKLGTNAKAAPSASTPRLPVAPTA